MAEKKTAEKKTKEGTSKDNTITGRSAFLALLKDEGVTTLFGNPGTTELPIMHALKEHPDLQYVMGIYGLNGGHIIVHGVAQDHNALLMSPGVWPAPSLLRSRDHRAKRGADTGPSFLF